MRQKVSLEDWIQDVKKRTRNSSMIRPKRPFRRIDSRSPEESEALGQAVVRNWNNALKSGALVKEEDGSYRICTKKAR